MWRGGGWREPRAVPPAPDYKDASIVQAEWRCLMPLDKDVLMLHYVWRAHSSFICRRLKLKQGRGNEHIWEFALYHAQQAISDKLEKANGLVNRVNADYTARRLLTPA
jgi:toxin CptA